MADNFNFSAGSGLTGAADEISSVLYPRVKLTLGADGVNDGDVASGNPMPVSDAGGSLTVDGTVAVTNAGITSIDGKITACNTGAVVLAAGSAAIGKLAANSGVDIGDVDVTSCALPTGASTSANQTTIIGHVDGIETLLGTMDADTSSLAGCVGGTELQVDVVSSALPTGAATEATLWDIKTAVQIIDDWDDSDKCKVSDGGGSLTVDGTVTAELSATDNAVLDAIAADTGNIKTAVEVIDNAISGSEMQVDVVAALPAGTNTIGAVTMAPDTNRVQGKVDNADTTTAREVLAAIASNYVYITSFVISVAAAGNYWLEDGDAAQITPKFYLAANGGVSWTAQGTTPYKTTTANKAINVKGSTAGAVGVMLTGYKSTT